LLFGPAARLRSAAERIRVEQRGQGYPAVWLNNQPGLAWIFVNVGPADWSKLAYQFGHELGHVFCNSWDAGAKPRASDAMA